MCLNLLLQFEVSIVYRRVCSSFRAREEEDFAGGGIMSFHSAMQLVVLFLSCCQEESTLSMQASWRTLFSNAWRGVIRIL